METIANLHIKTQSKRQFFKSGIAYIHSKQDQK